MLLEEGQGRSIYYAATVPSSKDSTECSKGVLTPPPSPGRGRPLICITIWGARMENIPQGHQSESGDTRYK